MHPDRAWKISGPPAGPTEKRLRGTGEIAGGTIVSPDGTIERGIVRFEEGVITSVTPHSGPLPVNALDVRDRVVMPGLVDLHGDDLEQHLSPRTNVTLDPQLAGSTVDRTNLAAGITTKFHAIAVEENVEGLRSPQRARELAALIDKSSDYLVDHRIHLRCELGCEQVVRELLEEVPVELISMMNHVPGAGQFEQMDTFRDHYLGDKDLSPDAVELLVEKRQANTNGHRWKRARELAKDADARCIPLASHDDETGACVDRAATIGAQICEFPLTLDAALRARALGLTTVMGAPNLVQGASQWGNLSARDAVSADAVDVICADYHPPSMLMAAFVETGESLSQRVARVTKKPADAAGLLRRGRIEPGAQADILVVDPKPIPTVDRVILDGHEVLAVGG